MADVFTRQKRTAVMARIRSRGNRDTELALARLLRRRRITGWRRHLEIRVSGFGFRIFRVKPDFVFPKQRAAVFVDGCFWHGCPRHGTWPAERAAWWRAKILGNQRRDALVTRALRRAGWRVVRVWEHTVRRAAQSPKHQTRLVGRIQRALGGD